MPSLCEGAEKEATWDGAMVGLSSSSLGLGRWMREKKLNEREHRPWTFVARFSPTPNPGYLFGWDQVCQSKSQPSKPEQAKIGACRLTHRPPC